MKMIYVVIVQMTGCINGNIIHCVDSAYTNEENAHAACNRMMEQNQNDSNFIAYVTGPITLDS